jgi:protein-S-isoprenylcysteine O-methyltransferase Ste14
MSAIALLVWGCAFSSFGWGVLHFFRKPSGPTGRTVSVAALGCIFGVWHLAALATSTVGRLPLCTGIALLAASMTIFWWAVRACESRRLTAIFESDVPVHLVRRGPYQYVRHPFYASYTMFWLAGWIASDSFLALVSALIMFGIYLDAIRKEERKFSSSPLAADYAEYRRHAGLMLPRLHAARKAIRRRCPIRQRRSTRADAT